MAAIRTYRESDEAAVAALWREVFPDAPPWNEPEDDIKRKLAVKPSRRRRRIGAVLVKRVEEELAARGCPKLNLRVRAPNRRAVAFYERLGYDVEERVSMEKRLKGAALGGKD
jgi:GNAT superfamily N-acetyltransferase